MTDAERGSLYAYVTALTAGLIGWFVCALFASVAYSWTFYIVLALLVATRDLVRTPGSRWHNRKRFLHWEERDVDRQVA